MNNLKQINQSYQRKMILKIEFTDTMIAYFNTSENEHADASSTKPG